MAGEAKVLLVDDRAEARALVAGDLAEAGLAVVEARDGVEAWNRFRAEAPDLVVSDLRMPRADGIELLRRIRGISSVPFILLDGVRRRRDGRRGDQGRRAGVLHVSGRSRAHGRARPRAGLRLGVAARRRPARAARGRAQRGDAARARADPGARRPERAGARARRAGHRARSGRARDPRAWRQRRRAAA